MTLARTFSISARHVRAGLLACLVALAACDSGPKGPGALTGRVTGENLGGVLLRVQGPGIQSFSGLGSAQVYSAVVETKVDTHRVLIVSPDAGELQFQIMVDDRAMEGPVVTVLQAALADNRAVSAAVATVSIER